MSGRSPELQFIEALIHREGFRALAWVAEYGAARCSFEGFLLHVEPVETGRVALVLRSSEGETLLAMGPEQLRGVCERRLLDILDRLQSTKPSRSEARSFAPIQIRLEGRPRHRTPAPPVRAPTAGSPVWRRGILSMPGTC